MNTRVVFLAGSVIFAAGVPSAQAADIYAPSGGLKDGGIQEQVILPEAEVFQEYAEWYIRGDIGIGRFADEDATGDVDGTNFAVNRLDFDNVYSFSAGFGRYITPNVRLGIDYEYRHDSASKFSTGDPAAVAALTNLGTSPLELTTSTVMFNAVYDFAPSRRFSPYLGGGVGWAFHQLNLKDGSFTNDVDGVAGLDTATVDGGSNSSSSFAANFVTGLSVNVRKGLFLDVGYKFSYLGDADTNFGYTHATLPDGTASIELEDIMTHEFKIGLRYDLY